MSFPHLMSKQVRRYSLRHLRCRFGCLQSTQQPIRLGARYVMQVPVVRWGSRRYNSKLPTSKVGMQIALKHPCNYVHWFRKDDNNYIDLREHCRSCLHATTHNEPRYIRDISGQRTTDHLIHLAYIEWHRLVFQDLMLLMTFKMK